MEDFEALEKKLSYEDIRFYRSIARSRLKKDLAVRKKLEQEKKEQPQKQGWTSWLWGTSSDETNKEDPAFGGPMTAEQRQQLYDVLDFDEKTALVESLRAPRDSLKARIAARLNRGSFALKSDPHGKAEEVLSVTFDNLQANFIQRPNNFESSVSLGGFGVFDGTTKNSLYPQIVHVKVNEIVPASGTRVTQTFDAPQQSQDEAFFFIKFESKPLDERADNALTVRMRHMEIIYHRGYIEAVYKFFKPPASQLESVEALLVRISDTNTSHSNQTIYQNVASQTLEGLRKETRAGLEFALQNHKTIDVQMDMNAPVIIIPEEYDRDPLRYSHSNPALSVTTHNCKHLIIDAGHIAIESDLADKDAIRAIHLKRNQQYSDEDYKNLEELMYDKVSLRLEAAQVPRHFHRFNSMSRSKDVLLVHCRKRPTVVSGSANCWLARFPPSSGKNKH